MKTFVLLYILILSISCTKDPIIPDNRVMDVDGNIYLTKQFGTQTWMMENLQTTRYNTSEKRPDDIPGRYSFYEVEIGNLCPLGYHVPKHWEWIVLYEHLKTNNILPTIGSLGYWWTSSTLVEGYESPQAWAWYQNDDNGKLDAYIELKETYLSVRCVKDY